jgi:hypothetical protein
MNSKTYGFGMAFIFISALVVYQSTLRYEYMKSGYRIERIDRLAGSICTMPCTPAPEPTATPERTYDTDDEVAVQAVKEEIPGEKLTEIAGTGTNYMWHVSERVTQDNVQIAPGQVMPDGDDPSDFRYRLICYCREQKNGQLLGTFWEYDFQTRHILSVNDDAGLSKKYNVTKQ